MEWILAVIAFAILLALPVYGFILQDKEMKRLGVNDRRGDREVKVTDGRDQPSR